MLYGGIAVQKRYISASFFSPNSNEMPKAKAKSKHGRKRSQMVLSSRDPDFSFNSQADTVPMDVSGNERLEEVQQEEDEEQARYETDATVGDVTLLDLEEPGLILSGSDTYSDLEDEAVRIKETDPMRADMDIVTDRWNQDEVDALMTAINVNRDAIKFHFDGPGGGREVKRQGWRDVASYVNDMAETHRTVKQCRTKVSDYTQRCKAKFNKLRFAIATTGKGKINKKLKIKKVEGKALDYLKEEAVKGIPGIEPMPIPGLVSKKPSRRNLKMQWDQERATKPDYNNIPMKREGVPKNYGEKNRRRVNREDKEKRKKEHERAMRKERKREKIEAKEQKKIRKLDKIQERKARKEEKKKALAKKKRREMRNKLVQAECSQEHEKRLKKKEKKKDKKKEKKEGKKDNRKRSEGKKKRVVLNTGSIPGIQPMRLI